MRRSLTYVVEAPSAVYFVASVASVAVKGTFGIGGMTILSRTSRTPPSCEAGPERRISGVWARQARLVNQRIPAVEVRMFPPRPGFQDATSKVEPRQDAGSRSTERGRAESAAAIKSGGWSEVHPPRSGGTSDVRYRATLTRRGEKRESTRVLFAVICAEAVPDLRVS